jgi:hypothetical protein
MNGESLVETVRESERTALDRLGSDKAMIAATGADLAADPVLGHVALTLDGIQTACESWGDETGEGAAGDLFATTVEAVGEEHERVVDAMGDDPTGDRPATAAVLDRFEAAPERVGALVGASLVLDRTLLQAVNFFVNEADQRRADIVRDARAAANTVGDEAAVALDEVCADEADREAATTAACEVVDAAYGEYVDALDALGIDPKPVC